MSDKKSLGERADGAGFDKSEFTGEERARARHRFHILDDELKNPESLIDSVDPRHIGRHIGLGALVGVSLFIRDNKAVIAGLIGLLGVVNSQTIWKLLQFILGLLP